MGCCYTSLPCYETSEPNQWMLVIQDGELVKAGVGIQHWRSTGQVVARFSSAIQKVTFKCAQVTTEMAGVEVSGFAIWTIHRGDDKDMSGPFKAFRSLDGLSEDGLRRANENMAQMAGSVIRHQIANMSINDVNTQRELLRNKAKEELTAVAKGWGVWIETVEITDVKISSSTLFENMQAQYKQKMRLEAEDVKMATQKVIDEKKSNMDLEKRNMQAENDSKRIVFKAEQDLKSEAKRAEVEQRRMAINRAKVDRDYELSNYKKEKRAQEEIQEAKRRAEIENKNQANEKSRVDRYNEMQAYKQKKNAELEVEQERQRAEVQVKKLELAKAKYERDHAYTLYKREKQHELDLDLHKRGLVNLANEQAKTLARLENEQEVLSKRAEKEMERAAKLAEHSNALRMNQIKLEQNMNGTNMKIQMMNDVKDIYDKIPLREMKVINVNNGDKKGDMTSMLTSFMSVVNESKTE